MAELKSPAGTLVTAEGDLVKRLVSQGWVDLTVKPKAVPTPKKSEQSGKSGK